jgi:adhesin transport system outer membrane protein
MKIAAITLALVVGLAAVMTGCASPAPTPKPPQSYVALLPSPDGTIGKVVVQGPHGEQALTVAQQGVFLDGSAAPFDVSAGKLQRDFGAAMAARPPLPEHFMLYFISGGSELTQESRDLVPRIIERALARQSVDMSVIGHTDTQGTADTNEALALKRAIAIAEQLRGMGLADAVMAIESHGERNLLVPTPDDTAEPGNRRVEITLR